MSRKIIRVFISTIVIIFVFLSSASIKSMASNSFLDYFFDKLTLKVAPSSINIDSSSKIVYISKNQNDSNYLKIKANPNDWTINIKDFKWIFLNHLNDPYDLNIKSSGTTIIISGNTFNGTDTDINVSLSKNTSNRSNSDESTMENTTKQAKTYKKGSKHIIKNVEYTITSKNTVSLYKSKTKSKKVTIPSVVKIGNKSYKVTEISPNAFKNNKKIKEISLPKTLKTIGEKSFYGCKNLKNIKCNIASLKKIKKQAFKGIKNNAKFAIAAKNKRSYNSCIKLIKKAAPKSNFSYTMIKEKSKKSK